MAEVGNVMVAEVQVAGRAIEQVIALKLSFEERPFCSKLGSRSKIGWASS